MSLVDEALAAGARLCAICPILGLSIRTVQRWRCTGGGDDGRHGPNTVPKNKLSEAERKKVVDIANSPEFRDLSPKQIVPTLADRGEYCGSESTFYRVLHEQDMVKHRAKTRPPRPRPRALRATGPNQVWSWDITYLRGPVRGAFFYLYLIVDVYSRKIVSFRVEDYECMELSSELIVWACAREGVERDQLTLHSDNGGPMKGATMLATLLVLGVVASFSRPRVSNDNPYSESLFRTLKYRPGYPSKPFESIDAARAWVTGFVRWYNCEHLHSAIRFVTPDDRHEGRDGEVLAKRKRVWESARKRRPERWSGSTRDWTPVGAVLLNPEPGHLRAPSELAAAA